MEEAAGADIIAEVAVEVMILLIIEYGLEEEEVMVMEEVEQMAMDYMEEEVVAEEMVETVSV